MDVHAHRAITQGLRSRGVDVLTAQEDGAIRLSDSALLDRATYLGRVLFTYDDDHLAEASRRQAEGQRFAGIVFIPSRNIAIGSCISDLAALASGDPEEMENCVQYLPLRPHP
jgi:hypothetical protein